MKNCCICKCEYGNEFFAGVWFGSDYKRGLYLVHHSNSDSTHICKICLVALKKELKDFDLNDLKEESNHDNNH